MTTVGSLAAFPNSRPSRRSSKGSLDEKPVWVWPQISKLCLTLTCPAAPRPQSASKSHFSNPVISPKYKFWRKTTPQAQHAVFEGAGRGLVQPKRGLQEALGQTSCKAQPKNPNSEEIKAKKEKIYSPLHNICNVRTCRERIVFGCFHKPLPILIKAFRKLQNQM